MSSDDASSRKTRAIMFSDITGYSKLMNENETRALRLLEEHNALLVPIVKAHGGQVLKFIGDAVLAAYESAADAVLAAVEIQQALAKRNAQAGPEEQVRVRIGVHVGDVVLKDGDVFGDGVNVAARLEPQAEPGGIAISQTVHDMIRARPEIQTEPMGVRELKNISQPMAVYRVCFEGAPPGAARTASAVPSVPVPPPVPQVPLDLSKLSRRERRRLVRAQAANPLEAVVWIAAALACLGYAVYRPEMWWMIFVALGPAKRAASILGRRKLPQPALPQAAAAPPAPSREAKPKSAEQAKLDALCDKLDADLAAAPDIAREVIKNPQKTVAGLRAGCHTLLQRAAQLRELSGEAELSRLRDERQGLASRVAAEADPVTRGKLQAALDAIDAQKKQREELAASAGRLEAEYTRLYYALENLHMQVVRVRSVDLASESQQQGLRQNAERLVSEMDAVAQALEELNRPAAIDPISPVGEAVEAPRAERARVR